MGRRVYKVVILDDEREISNGFAMFFPWNTLGFSVEGQFRRAQEALEYIEKHPVDLIVSDIRMPGMDGIELAQRIAQMHEEHKPKIVFFSAYGEFAYAQQAMKYGVIQYILKTSPYEELTAIFEGIREKLDEEYNKIEDKGEEGEELSGDQALTAMKEYIKKHLKDASLEEMAREVYMSPAYASRYFKTKTEENFQDYLIRQRMERAVVLLKDLQYRVSDISDMVGYSNPFNFTRTFKKYYGKTPKEYRRERTDGPLPDDENEKEL